MALCSVSSTVASIIDLLTLCVGKSNTDWSLLIARMAWHDAALTPNAFFICHLLSWSVRWLGNDFQFQYNALADY